MPAPRTTRPSQARIPRVRWDHVPRTGLAMNTR